jgi:hypothetical protein
MSAELKPVSIIPDREPQLPAVTTPMTMLAQAVDKGMSPETIDKLMALAERWDATNARKAFDRAIAAAKAEIKPVIRNAKGHNNKAYADFAAIAQAVDPIISKHGLSYRFRTTQDDKIKVTCVLSHEAGHYEETTLAGPSDTTGNKNAIQAIGSTLTYLQRYSLVQALGLAAANDDDGKAGGNGETITEDQATQLIDLMESVTADRAKFLKFFQIESIMSLPAGKFGQAMDMLKQKAKG